MWSDRNAPPLLVGMQTCTITLEISMAVSQEIENQPTSGPNNTTGICTQRMLNHTTSTLFNYVHSNITCNRQNLETTKMPFNQRMDKENVVRLQNRVLLSSKTKKNNDILKFACK